MKTRKINVTILCPDDDFSEHKLEQTLYSIIGHTNIIDYRKFPEIEHLKQDPTYIKLNKAKKQAGLELDRYINENRNAGNS